MNSVDRLSESFSNSLMTNNKQLFAILSLSSILIIGGFSYSQLAYSSGDDDDDHDGWKKYKKSKIEHDLCQSPDNLISNGCFEYPDVNDPPNPKGWQIYPSFEALPNWDVEWLEQVQPCEDFPGLEGQLELQRGILGGPAEGAQHAELDSDCNGPNAPGGGDELTSVAISQSVVSTSSTDEYQITFAYKARPGKDVPLKTNGLLVVWNDADVTPDIKFSKKNWKWATVTVQGIDGDSVIKFVDDGKPDTLGTFLDDVSVIKVPKPDIKIILNKEIDNSDANEGDVIIEDPAMFFIEINGGSATLGEDNPNVFPDAGDFEFTETATNYVATVTGDDDCPGINDGSTVSLVPGDVLECDILNKYVPPPTITMKKVITQDNTDDADESAVTASDFKMFIQGVGLDGIPGNEDDEAPIEIDIENKPVPPGTYSFHETGPDFYEFVLIAGDTGCPLMDMNMDTFTLESGQHLTCVVYNDDDKDAPTGGGEGVFFARNSLQMRLNLEFGFIDPEFSAHSCENLPSMVVRPCIVEDSNGNLLIVDPAFDQQGGHLATVSATVQPAGPGSEIDCHSPSGIELFNYPDADVGGPGEDGIPGTSDDDDDLWVRGFSIPCNLSGGDGGIFFVDYTIVQTEIDSPWDSDGIDNDGDGTADEAGEGDGINNDMDCTEDATGDHFFGDKTNFDADDCYDEFNVVLTGFTESIDEDAYNSTDDDSDGFLDEDP